MPVFNSNETIPVGPNQPDTPVPIDNALTYTNQEVVGDCITAHISGISTITTYFNRYLGDDQTVDQGHENYAIAQYSKIINLDIKLSDKLQHSTPVDTQVSTVTGTASVPPVLTPQTGDFFTIDLGDGNTGQMSVTSVRRMSHFRMAVHEIDFTLIAYVTDTLREQWDSRVISTYYFDRRSGAGKLVTAAQQAASVDITTLKQNLIRDLFAEFYSFSQKTFLIPTNGSNDTRLYDPWTVEFFTKVVTDPRHPVKVWDIKRAIFDTEIFTVWDALLSRRPIDSYRPRLATEWTQLPSSRFKASYIYRTIASAQIQSVTYPTRVGAIRYSATDYSPVEYVISTDYIANGDKGQSLTDIDRMFHRVITGTQIPYKDIEAQVSTLHSLTPLRRFRVGVFLLGVLSIPR